MAYMDSMDLTVQCPLKFNHSLTPKIFDLLVSWCLVDLIPFLYMGDEISQVFSNCFFFSVPIEIIFSFMQ